MFEKHEILLE